jgi:hypothetical protein
MTWFDLQTAHDLYTKLGRERQALQEEPTSSDIAFNFFVTAWHLLDWKYPGDGNIATRKARRDSEPLLQLLDHLANGLKHFEITQKKHESLQETGVSSDWFARGWFEPGWFAPGWFGGGDLIVKLNGPARAAFGSHITVLDLAAKVMTFWDNEIGK